MPENPYVLEMYTGLWLWREQPKQYRRFDIELTERCNLNCIHCYINRPAGDQAARAAEMSTERIKAILQEAADLEKLVIKMTGGEPLLRNDFEEIYTFARRLGFKVELFTNATLTTPRLADLFAHIPPLDKIDISVYGMSAESYEAVTRRPGSYKAFRRAIDLLLEREVPIAVKMIVLPPNKHEVKAFEEWSATIPGMDQTPPIGALYSKRTRRDSDSKSDAIAEMRHTPEEMVSMLRRDQEGYRASMQAFCGKFMGPPGELLFGCGSGLTGAVDAYGRLQPCLAMRHPDYTIDLAEHSLRECLLEIYPRMREIRAKNPEYLARCARCFLKALCGQCPGNSWSEHGELDQPVEYLCDVAHTQARSLGLLEEGENAWDIDDWEARVQTIMEGSPWSQAPGNHPGHE
ncbi:MAG: radical SAM protein [Anaerolineales bacterium]|jgi:radical SAM protein with 4Fe4S-binding SPASM domain